MNLRVLTNSELLRIAESSDDSLVIELSKRLEDLYDLGYNIDKIEENDSEKYKDLCISYITDVSGEDFHSDVISKIQKLNGFSKKEDRKKEIDNIINILNNLDYRALNIIESIKKDGLEQ